MDKLLKDIRYSIRLLLKSPGPTLIALATLALGIGGNTAIFSVVNSVVFRPLKFAEPGRLVMLRDKFVKSNQNINVSPRELEAYKERAESFEQIAAYDGAGFNLSGVGDPEQIRGAFISPNLFATLGVHPLLGRDFTLDEEQSGRNQVVMIGYGLWQRRFAGDPNIAGTTVLLEGKPHTIVGVMPRNFEFPIWAARAEMWAPMDREYLVKELPNAHFYKVVGRLKSGVSVAQANAEMEALAARLEQESPRSNAGIGAMVMPLHQFVTGDVRTALLILLAAVGLVLMIACANVANILLVRATARYKEIAVRTALGASRGRLIRQLLTESIVLSVAGGLLGLGLAFWAVDLLVAASPANLPRLGEVAVDLPVLVFTFAASLATGAIFGLVPALQSSKPDLNEALKEGTRGATAGSRRHRARSLLVVAEIALSLVLLASAGLMIKSFVKLQQVNSGFAMDNVLTVEMLLSRSRYPEESQMAEFHRQATERLRAIPGVESVGSSTHFPLVNSIEDGFDIVGRPPAQPGTEPTAVISPVGGDYFRAVGIPLIEGRTFTDQDREGTPGVVIIDDRLARDYFEGEDPIGRSLETLHGKFTIVGVVGSVKSYGLEAKAPPNIYLPYVQLPEGLFGLLGRGMVFALRTTSDPMSVASATRSEILRLDKDQPVFNVKPMEQLFSEAFGERRFNTMLLAAFAGVALLLAAVGIYGVMSYAVAQRTHEIGIRVALGARRRDVLRLVVGEGMLLAVIGIAVGVAGAIGLTRFISGLLFSVSPTDPLTLGTVALMLLGIALLACYVPARRASSVDPIRALRYE